jgi:hypothetical protein
MTRRRRKTGIIDRLFGTPRPGEVYGYRTLRPSRRRPRHWAYVGKTRDGRRRHRQHMGVRLPGDRYDAPGQPWNDLDPHRYVLWRSAKVRGWRLSLMEFVFIRLLLPVYNVQMNRANPRRIGPRMARMQRDARDAGLWVAPDVARVKWGVRVALTVSGVILVVAGLAGAILAP